MPGRGHRSRSGARSIRIPIRLCVSPPLVTRSPGAPAGMSLRRIVDAPVGGARAAVGNGLRAISRGRSPSLHSDPSRPARRLNGIASEQQRRRPKPTTSFLARGDPARVIRCPCPGLDMGDILHPHGEKHGKLASLFCRLLEHNPVRNRDPCSLDAHAARPLPFAQAFVDALTRRSNDVPELALGHLNPISGPS
jgi:hypothetical protein